MSLATTIANHKIAEENRVAENEAKIAMERLDSLILSNRARAREEKKIQNTLEASRASAFEKEKKMKIAGIQMDAAASSVAMWLSVWRSGTPPPVAVVMGGIMQGLIAANAIAQTAVIAKEHYQDGGIIGGVKGGTYGSDNTVVNARKGEGIINVPQQRRLLDLIDGRALPKNSGNNITLNIDKFTGSENDLQSLKDMLIKLNDKSQLNFMKG
jgi:hypothetical protein